MHFLVLQRLFDPISCTGPDNEADQSMMMATQMTAPGAPPDMKKAYKEEWEALEVCSRAN